MLFFVKFVDSFNLDKIIYVLTPRAVLTITSTKSHVLLSPIRTEGNISQVRSRQLADYFSGKVLTKIT